MNVSSVWQKISKLSPSLSGNIAIQVRNYSGENWYLLHDKVGARFHRINETAYQLINLMNGRNNLAQIMDLSRANYSDRLDDAPTNEELVELVQYLYVADLLVCDFPPDTQDIIRRQRHKHKQTIKQLVRSPFSWRIRIFDPDCLLTKLLPVAKFLVSRAMLVVWLFVIVISIVQLIIKWEIISAPSLNHIFSPGNLFLIWLVYPLMKVLHELGHGLFTKAWGQEVHEFGVVVILGTPLPYIDATAATAFRSKKQRLMVSAAGIFVELFVAAIAFLVWLNVESGFIKDLLFNIILIGSISTVFFNANPLMRFDGYYMLCDLIDQPNLATRAKNQLLYFLKRYVYGMEGLYSCAVSNLGSCSLVFYSISAFFYRMFVLLAIVYIAISHFPLLGVVLLCWLVLFQLLLPAMEYFVYLFKSNDLERVRKRALVSVIGFSLVVILSLFYIPLPQKTRAQGVVWLPMDARVRSESEGVLRELYVSDGDWVAEGEPLFKLVNPELMKELNVKKASYNEFKVREQRSWGESRAQSKIFKEDLKAIHSEVDHLQLRVDNLVIRSKTAGQFKVLKKHDLHNIFVEKGDVLGVVLSASKQEVRVAVKQEDIASVREDTRRVEVRLASDLANPLLGKIVNQVPGGTNSLPSPVLGTAGGGSLLVQNDRDISISVERVFIVDVALDELMPAIFYGERAYVVFYHKAVPLASQLQRSVQQLIIKVLKS